MAIRYSVRARSGQTQSGASRGLRALESRRVSMGRRRRVDPGRWRARRQRIGCADAERGRNRVVGYRRLPARQSSSRSTMRSTHRRRARSMRVRGDRRTPTACTHLMLPGRRRLRLLRRSTRRAAGWLSRLVERWAFAERRPLLGICVGMQLLGRSTATSRRRRRRARLDRWADVKSHRAGDPRHTRPARRLEHRDASSSTSGAVRAVTRRGFLLRSLLRLSPAAARRRRRLLQHGVRFSAVVRRDNLSPRSSIPRRARQRAALLRLPRR